LHRPGTQGASVCQAIARSAGAAAGFALRFDTKDCHYVGSWHRLRGLARVLGERHRIIADLDAGGPLALPDHGEWSFGWQDRYLRAAKALRGTRQTECAALQALVTAFGLAPDAGAEAGIATALRRLAEQRLNRPGIAPLDLRDPAAAGLALESLIAALEGAAKARAALAAHYPDDGPEAMPPRGAGGAVA